MTRAQQHHHTLMKLYVVHGSMDDEKRTWYEDHHTVRWVARQRRLTDRLRRVHARLKTWQNRTK